MVNILIIVPCGKRKIWDHQPRHGPTQAKDAYEGTLFRLNRRYAEMYGDGWLVLSARYGFIAPDFVIPGPYDVTFKKKASNPIDIESLQVQVAKLDLHYMFSCGRSGRRGVPGESLAGIWQRDRFARISVRGPETWIHAPGNEAGDRQRHFRTPG